MAGLKANQFVLLFSLVISSTHALNVLLTDGKSANTFAQTSNSGGGFIYSTTIKIGIDESGHNRYDGCVDNSSYTPGQNTTTVIVYLKSWDALRKGALRRLCRDERLKISEDLKKQHYELLYLAVNGYKPGYYRFIAEFIPKAINIDRSKIKTIGDYRLDLDYDNLGRYVEDANVYGGILRQKLQSLD